MKYQNADIPNLISDIITECPLVFNESKNPFPNTTIPYLVYHGTNQSPFKEFKYQSSKRFVLFAEFDVEAKGFFFSESPYDALEFGDNVIACYINLVQPLIDPRRDKHLGIEGFEPRKEIDIMKILAPMIEKDEEGYHYIDYMITRNYLQHRKRATAREWLYDAIDTGGLLWDALDNPGVVQKMTKLSYDGTFVHEPDLQLGRSIFVISPKQVQMVEWVKGAQENWGDPNEWNTEKDEMGYPKLNNPRENLD